MQRDGAISTSGGGDLIQEELVMQMEVLLLHTALEVDLWPPKKKLFTIYTLRFSQWDCLLFSLLWKLFRANASDGSGNGVNSRFLEAWLAFKNGCRRPFSKSIPFMSVRTEWRAVDTWKVHNFTKVTSSYRFFCPTDNPKKKQLFIYHKWNRKVKNPHIQDGGTSKWLIFLL